MFKQSEIGKPCNCGKGETVCKEHAFKRYRLPKGHFSDGYYFAGGYYMVGWWSLECETCGNKRDDIIVYKWHSNNDWTPIDSPFHDEKRPRRYPEIYNWIVQQLAD
jgi:hypothetical protein